MKSIHTESAKKRQKGNAQKGNAMLYVLLGVVLFAALTYLLTRSSNSSGSASMEHSTIYAQEILTYADKINGAVQNVMLQNNCLSTQLNFDNTVVSGYTNPLAPANKRCNIFDLAGGGATFEAPPPEAIDTASAAASTFPAGALAGNYFFTGKTCVDNVGTGPYTTCAASGGTQEELLLVLPWITQDVCTAINTVLGNSAPILQEPAATFDNTKFIGTYADGYAIGAAGFTTYQTGCYQSTSAGNSPGLGYHFYYTLVAR